MTSSTTINAAEAIRQALIEVGKRDPSVLLFAEGIADPGSVYGTTKGLTDIYGADRIIEMPVAESGLCGVAIGAAMMGKRVVVNFHRVEFALLAMEQIFNNAAKASFASNGTHSVPIVIRLVIGRGWGQGPNHSQSLEPVFAHIPGLKVIMPTYPADMKGMMIAAVEDNNPVIVIEHRWCHYTQGDVPDGYYVTPLDGPKVVRKGKDLTIVATSYMVLEAVRAADLLADIGISVEVLDLRVLRPLNIDLIAKSITKTGHLMTVDTGHKHFGIGGEVISQLVETNIQAFKKGPMRLGPLDCPTPSSRGMIPGFYPDAESIMRAAQNLLDFDAEKIDGLVKKLFEERGDLPIDIPDPLFRGPF